MTGQEVDWRSQPVTVESQLLAEAAADSVDSVDSVDLHCARDKTTKDYSSHA